MPSEPNAASAAAASMVALPFYDADPYLEYQPGFAYTLPIQVLVTGITLTLLVILLIHLLFTTQYHYPLAPLNYCLQLASILTVLLGTCVRVGVILQHLNEMADQWPYTLDYIAVPVPAPKWNDGEDAAWYTLLAVCNGLANLTHIQFLTLLYPSRTEARLIFIALGPLAIASSALYYCTLSENPKVIDMGDAIRSVFSCTLLVIFSLSLFIWGFFVNRRRAWRLDGGTAVFGCGALGLALVTTASSFVAVKEEGIDWLQHLIWAAVLWQTWLGWWWWVGAGMGIGEVEDIMERSMRKRRKAARREHRRRMLEAANNEEAGGTQNGRPAARRQTSVAGMVKNGTSAVVGFTSSLAHLRTGSNHGSAPGSAADAAPESSTGVASVRLRLRNRQSHAPPPRDIEEGVADDVEEIELGALRLREPTREPGAPENDSALGSGSGSGGRNAQSSNSNSETSSTSRTPSLHAPRSVGEFVSYPATWLQVYIRRLRRAHEEAARRRAVEQAERRSRVPTMAGTAPDDGWGLGSFGLREHQESSWRLHEADRQLRTNVLIDTRKESDDAGGDDGETGDDDEDDGDDVHNDIRPNGRDSSGTTVVGDRARGRQVAQSLRPESRHESARTSRRNSSQPRDRDRSRDEAVPADATHDAEAEWEDIDEHDDRDGDGDRGEDGRPASRQSGDSTARPGGTQTWSWWGPLRDWRLRDRSQF